MTEKRPPVERKAFTVEEVGQVLGIGRTTAYQAVRTGQIPSVRVGRRIVVPMSSMSGLLGGEKANPALVTGQAGSVNAEGGK